MRSLVEMLSGQPTVSLVINHSQLLWRVSSLDSWVWIRPMMAWVLDKAHALSNNNNNNRRLVTLAEHTSDHGKQTNSSTKERGSRARKLLGANDKSYRLKLKTK